MAKKEENGIGEKISSVTDFITTFFKKALNVQKRIDDLKEDVRKFIISVKKNFYKTVLDAVILSSGVLALIIGIILLLKRYLPLEYILIGYGLITTIFILVRLKLE